MKKKKVFESHLFIINIYISLTNITTALNLRTLLKEKKKKIVKIQKLNNKR